VNLPTAYLLGGVLMACYAVATMIATRRRLRAGTPTKRDRRRGRIAGDYGWPFAVILAAALWPLTLGLLLSNLLDGPGEDGPRGGATSRWR
jgi:MFS family permease